MSPPVSLVLIGLKVLHWAHYSQRKWGWSNSNRPISGCLGTRGKYNPTPGDEGQPFPKESQETLRGKEEWWLKHKYQNVWLDPQKQSKRRALLLFPVLAPGQQQLSYQSILTRLFKGTPMSEVGGWRQQLKLPRPSQILAHCGQASASWARFPVGPLGKEEPVVSPGT